MSVKIGSARIDENGRATGGAAGDQTGREVSTQSWYRHSKGWRVFRAKSAEAAEKIAQDMQWACDNKAIGYDQGQRTTLYNVAKPLDFSCKAVKEKCETDCSALVRVCCAYAGIMLPNFRTPTEPAALLDSGAFTELTGSKYTDSPDYLRRGDILVTRTQGHTVVVLSNGSKAGTESVVIAPVAEYRLGERELSNGCEGADVKELQADLMKLGYALPKYGADGDFGGETEKAVREFQVTHNLTPDGVMHSDDFSVLFAALDGKAPEPPTPTPVAQKVEITGGSVNVRSAHGTKGTRVLGTVHKGDRLPYGGLTAEVDGRDWYLIEWENQNGWISSKYSKLVE